MEKICSIQGCGRKYYCKDLCRKHYNNKYKSENKEKEAAYDKIYSETDRGRFAKAKTKAKQRGLEFSLTFEQFAEISNYICYYCEDGLCGKPSFQGAHLDRLDNSKGYTIDNVVSCGILCNRIRMDHLTVQETRDAVHGILLGRLRREYGEKLYE